MLKPYRNETSKKGVKFGNTRRKAARCSQLLFPQGPIITEPITFCEALLPPYNFLQAHRIKLFMCVSEFTNMDSKYCSIHQ